MQERSIKSVDYEIVKDTLILHLDGELNSCGIKNFEGIMEVIMASQPVTIAVDCSKLLVLDPSTVSQLAQYMKRAKNSNIKLVLYNINPEVLMTLELMKLDGFFNLVSGEQFERRNINKNIVH